MRFDHELASAEGTESRARRDQPSGVAIVAEAHAAYLELARNAERDGAMAVRIALLTDAVRLCDGGVNTRDERAVALASAADQQREVIRWLEGESLGEGGARLRWLADATLVDLIQMARLARPGVSPATDADVPAMRAAVASARTLGDLYARVLALEHLAAAQWERGDLLGLARALDELAPIAPSPWRQALHRAHLAIAGGNHEDALRALAVVRRSASPADIVPYRRHLEGTLAAARGDLDTARAAFTAIRAGAFVGSARSRALETFERDRSALPTARELVSWAAPTFVLAREPRYELSIEVWLRVEGGHAHARFVAERLSAIDPGARWRRTQADELGVPAGRTHEPLLEALRAAPQQRKVMHARFGEGVLVRELEGGAKVEVSFGAAGSKVLLATAVRLVDDP